MTSDGLLLGRSAPAAAGFGFHDADAAATPGDWIRYDGEAPVTVIAPTGAGKGRDFLIPNLLEYPGPVIVVDLKGELSEVTARRRRELGHRVAVIRPFEGGGRPTDRIDPFDLFDLPGSLLECDAEMLASMLCEGHGVRDDPFWEDTGTSLVGGLIAMYAALRPEGVSGFQFVRDHLLSDEATYAIARLLDEHGKRNLFAYRELAGYIQHPEDRTRPSVLSTARTFLRALNTPQVAACLQDPTFRLREVMDGGPLDVFLTIPPEKAISHAGLIRMVVGSVLAAILRRGEIPDRRTLLVVDEAAQLGREFAPLLAASTLMRGYGLQLVTVWQDLAQLKGRYKTDWPTILNNSGAVLAFGVGHYAAAKDMAEVIGWEPADLLRMKPDEAALAVRGEGARKIIRANYLRDDRFSGLADPNPYHARKDRKAAGI